MNAEILLKKLSKLKLRDDPKELYAEAKKHGFVIVFGASDDLIEFRGAIYDEVGAYGGGNAFVTENGLVTNECDDEDCPYFQKERAKAQIIRAVWCPEKDGKTYASWKMETNIPHNTFKIMYDGELYCIGLVFLLTDAKTEK